MTLCSSYISFNEVQQRKPDFIKYLDNTRKRINIPTWLITKGMQLSRNHYTTQEIDAVPIAFPFFCERKYEEVFGFCDSDEFLQEVNKLLAMVEATCVGIKDTIKKRIKTHQIIHQWNCQKLRLPAATTTKQLAHMVEKRQIDINTFCKYQLVQFFVKYHLGIID
jgi:hypothetical protein